ncbi:hypothetical protein KUCAC02_010348 [Chaenocephalus aceratus]|uniref:Uncharacterized protein n=1 Tax=Chaenocephalus aceratus TaxID=36190 RepID=A0ACB9VZ15_CHAAC|nr:hypothetical protein KUCAC02_010348 [Chaenocephalus aceratus]
MSRPISALQIEKLVHWGHEGRMCNSTAMDISGCDPAVLRAWLQRGISGDRGELSVSFPLVLCGPVPEMLGPKRA